MSGFDNDQLDTKRVEPTSATHPEHDHELLGGGAPIPPTRIKRVWVVTAATLGIGLIAGALLSPYILRPQKPRAAAPVENTQATGSVIPMNAPRDYAQAHQMEAQAKGAPPNADQITPTGPMTSGPSLPSPSDTGAAENSSGVGPIKGGRMTATRDEPDIGGSSSVFFKDSGNTSQRPATAGTPSLTSPNSALTALASAAADKPLYGSDPLPSDAQGGLIAQKNAFLNNAGTTRDYVQQQLQHPRSNYEVKAGSVIAGALITAIDSDLPGEITAQVTENVYDSATGNYLLIPQGSRLIGKYDSLISYGQTRALVAWNRVILPNGNSLDLEAMPGSDETGAAGLEDEVDHHRLAFAGALLAATVLDIGPSLASSLSGSSGTTNIYAESAQQAGAQTSQIGENLLNRELARPNTITIRAGWPVRILVNKDLVFEAYKQ